MPKGQDLQPLDRQEYLERRKDLAEQYREAIGNYDKLVPWGAGGSLFLSITFLEKIAPHPLASSRWLLLASWALLLVALAASMWSHYTSSRIYSRRIKLLDNRQRVGKGNDTDGWEKEHKKLEAEVNRWGRLTAFLNPLAGWALVVGIALLAGFAVANAPFSTEP